MGAHLKTQESCPQEVLPWQRGVLDSLRGSIFDAAQPFGARVEIIVQSASEDLIGFSIVAGGKIIDRNYIQEIDKAIESAIKALQKETNLWAHVVDGGTEDDSGFAWTRSSWHFTVANKLGFVIEQPEPMQVSHSYLPSEAKPDVA